MAACCAVAAAPVDAAIPARYPLVELAVGAAFAATAIVLRHDPAQLALGLVFVAMLAAITLTDLERRIIPNTILLAGAVAAVALVATTDPSSFPERGLPPQAPAGCCSSSGWPIRAEWGWAT